MPRSRVIASSADVQELETAFKAVKKAAAPKDLDLDKIRKEFCELWPTIKKGLNFLVDLAGLVPSVGVLVKIAIKMVVTAGEAAYKAYCPKTNP